MFSRDQLKRLKKPRRERSHSAPIIPAYNHSDYSSDTTTDRRFVFARRRKQHSGDGDTATTTTSGFQSARRFEEHESSSSLSLDDSGTPSVQKVVASNNNITRNKRQVPLVKALVAALQKEHMLDVTLVGKDNATVRASRYVLACRCESLERVLYQNHATCICTTTSSPLQQDEQVYIGDYTEIVLRALVEYCFTGELIQFWKHHVSHATEHAVECMLQLSNCAHQYKFRLLSREVYQLARRFLNQHAQMALLFIILHGNHSHGASSSSSLEMISYAKQTIQECPREALLLESCRRHDYVTRLSPEQVSSLFQDGTLDSLSELDKVRVLQRWAAAAETSFVSVARNICSHYVDLKRILLSENDDDIRTTLIESGLFDTLPETIPTVSSEDDDNDDKDERSLAERVVVKGAGMESVNGIYYRNPTNDDEEDDDDEEYVMYVNSSGSVTLHCWNGTWHVAASCDLSNSLYQCEGKGVLLPPSVGWQSVGAPEPAPICTWMPPAATSVAVKERSLTQ